MKVRSVIVYVGSALLFILCFLDMLMMDVPNFEGSAFLMGCALIAIFYESIREVTE